MKRIMYIALAIVAAVLLVVSVSQERSFTEDIVIGAALSLTGNAAPDGESIKNGIELARADLARKGIDVKIIYQDDKTEPKDTVSAINALAAQGVDAIIGPTWSYLADAGVPVADKLGVVTVMPANTTEYVGAKSDKAFYTATRVELMEPVLAKWLRENGKKKVAFVRNQGAWYETVGTVAEKAVVDSGATIVHSEVIPWGADAATIATVLAKVRSSGAELLFFEVDDMANITTIFKKVEEQNIPIELMSVTTALGKVKQGVDIENKVYALSPTVSEEFNERYIEAYGTTAHAYADNAYDSLMLLVEALQSRGGVPLAEYLREKTRYSGYAKEYDFTETGDTLGGGWIVKEI